jgi:hypothetical protein
VQGAKAVKEPAEMPSIPPPHPAMETGGGECGGGAGGGSAHAEMLRKTEGMSVLQLDNTLERLKARLALRWRAVREVAMHE